MNAASLVAVVDGVREDREEHDQLLFGFLLALQGGVPRVLVKFIHSHGNEAHGGDRKDQAPDNKV